MSNILTKLQSRKTGYRFSDGITRAEQVLSSVEHKSVVLSKDAYKFLNEHTAWIEVGASFRLGVGASDAEIEQGFERTRHVIADLIYEDVPRALIRVEAAIYNGDKETA